MTPYEELTSPREMYADCEAVGRTLAQMPPSLRAPGIRYEDFPREIPKREIQISEAATRLANALQLHLD